MTGYGILEKMENDLTRDQRPADTVGHLEQPRWRQFFPIGQGLPSNRRDDPGDISVSDVRLPIDANTDVWLQRYNSLPRIAEFHLKPMMRARSGPRTIGLRTPR